jgi:hypothetical protein
VKRTITIQVDVEEGEHVLLVAMLSLGASLSIARKAKPTIFGALVQEHGPNDRMVSMKYGEPVDGAVETPPALPPGH